MKMKKVMAAMAIVAAVGKHVAGREPFKESVLLIRIQQLIRGKKKFLG